MRLTDYKGRNSYMLFIIREINLLISRDDLDEFSVLDRHYVSDRICDYNAPCQDCPACNSKPVFGLLFTCSILLYINKGVLNIHEI